MPHEPTENRLVRMTAWPREPQHLFAIATSETTRYDTRQVAWVKRAIFPHLGEELVLFVKLGVEDPDPPSLRVGAYPGVELRIRDQRGWRRAELGEYRIDPGYTHAFVSGTLPFEALAPWFFQTHIHIVTVVVDSRGTPVRIGRVFEIAAPVGDATIDAIRGGDIGAGARIALTVMAGTRCERPAFAARNDDNAEDDLDPDAELHTLWWHPEVEALVRRYELLGRMAMLVNLGARDDLEQLRARLKAEGGSELVALAVDVMAVFDFVGDRVLNVWWADDAGVEECSEVRAALRAHFELDADGISSLGWLRRLALGRAWGRFMR